MSMLIVGVKVANYKLQVDHHNGSCCGRFHIHGFPKLNQELNATPNAFEDKVQHIRDALEKGARSLYNSYGGERGDDGCGMDYEESIVSFCAEIVLIEDQLEDWAAAVAASGFLPVHNFRNSNSENLCHVYLLNYGGKYA